MIDPRPDNLDWVKDRRDSFPDCSLPLVFNILVQIAEINVRRANADRGKDPAVYFQHVPLGETLIVGRDRPLNGGTHSSVVIFELLEDSIVVSARASAGEPGKLLFRAFPGLAQDGDCILKIDGEPLRLWQIVRRALEDLFFLPPADPKPPLNI
jgi:hypothetical protein